MYAPRGRSVYRGKVVYARKTSNVGKFRYRAGTVRTRAYKKQASTARKIARLSRARAKPGRNKRQIVKNARAIRSLQLKSYGPLQRRTDTYLDGVHVLANHPVMIHVNNPHYSTIMHQSRGAEIASLDALGHYHAVGHFTAHYSAMREDETTQIPNGNRLYLKGIDYMLEFSGFVQDTSIVIHVVRQKTMAPQWYDQSLWAGNAQPMPYQLSKFKNLAGFTPDQIDRKSFQVLYTKRLYMDSKASASVEDALQDRATTPPTTNNVRRHRIRLKLDKHCKMLQDSVNELNGDDDDDIDNGNVGVSSSWGWNNQHPLANLWMIISSDDQTDLTSIVTGSAVNMKCIRRVYWRDRQD